MNKITFKILIIVSILAFITAPALATKPGEDVNPNGFPSGAHHNLNIHGKKLDFTCDSMVPEEDGYFGGSIFVPISGTDIEIVMQSGKKGPKNAPSITDLEVVDPCASFDGDPAVIMLPKNEFGYDVYARVLGKPTGDPTITIRDPELLMVQDENGNDLLWLGLITDNGFMTTSESFTRTKGKSTARDITGLFLWNGDVCYLVEPVGPYDFSEVKCCIDNDVPADGVYDECTDPTAGLCPLGYDPVTTYCIIYTNTWVFNIGDFVDYLWKADNDGVKLLQIRFYPRSDPRGE